MEPVICLSSDEEDESPRKKIKLDDKSQLKKLNENTVIKNNTNGVITIDDDDDDDGDDGVDFVGEFKREKINENDENQDAKIPVIESIVSLSTEKENTDKDVSKEQDIEDNTKSNETKKDETDTNNEINNDVANNIEEKVENAQINGDHVSDSELTTDKENNIEIMNCSGDDEFKKVTKIEDVEAEAETTPELAESIKEKFTEFLDTCREELKGSQYEESVLLNYPRIKRKFNDFNNLLNDEKFLDVLEENILLAKKSAAKAVCCFKNVYDYINDNSSISVEVEDENVLQKLRYLEHHINALNKRIKKLEEAEVESSGDEESNYILLERYQKRIVKVHKKYCELLKKNPFSGRITHEKLNFNCSAYKEINLAIIKKFKHDKFPTYYEMEKCIRKCSESNNLNLSENSIKIESRHCFEKLGEILQHRRRKELYDCHKYFISDTKDPAECDKSLAEILNRSAKEGKSRMDEIVNKFSEDPPPDLNDKDDETNSESDSSETS